MQVLGLFSLMILLSICTGLISFPILSLLFSIHSCHDLFYQMNLFIESSCCFVGCYTIPLFIYCMYHVLISLGEKMHTLGTMKWDERLWDGLRKKNENSGYCDCGFTFTSKYMAIVRACACGNHLEARKSCFGCARVVLGVGGGGGVVWLGFLAWEQSSLWFPPVSMTIMGLKSLDLLSLCKNGNHPIMLLSCPNLSWFWHDQ